MIDDDFLTPEQIAEATRKFTPEFYIFYDKDGNILSASNTVLDGYENYVQVSKDLYDQFVTGAEQFKDWVVNRTKSSSNELGVEVVPRSIQTLTFRNSLFEKITALDPDAEVTVQWNQYYKKWIFYLSDKAVHRVYTAEVSTKALMFFISLRESYDFLIRTIEVNVDDLLKGPVEVPFTVYAESDIHRISVATKSAFSSYSLEILHEGLNE